MMPQTQICMKREFMLAARPSSKPYKKVFGSDDEGSTTASGSDHDMSGSSSSDEDFAVPTCQRVETANRGSSPGLACWLSALLGCSRRASPAEKKAAAQAHPNVPVLAPRLATTVVIQPPWRKLAKNDDAKKDGVARRSTVAIVAPQQKKAKNEGAALLMAAVVACKNDHAAAEESFLPPPGLSAPAGLKPSSYTKLPRGFTAPPGLATVGVLGPPPGLELPPAFDIVLFRRELTAILRDLANDRRAATAVLLLRAQRVPSWRQAVEFADILTRAVEEPRGGVRQSILAFAAGLAAGRPSAFEREECAAGVGIFFEEIYPELLEEVPRLQTLSMMEVVPTLRSVFMPDELCPFLPEQFQAKMYA